MNYFLYRKKGFGRRHSLALALDNSWKSTLVWIFFCLVSGVLLGVAIHYGVSYMSKWQEDTLSNQAGYIKALEKVAATCLSPGDNAIWIGDELHFCGTARSGIKKGKS